MADDNEPVRIYFACVGNSARSQMAEGFARHYGGDRVEVQSGGTKPAGVVSSRATEAMREKGIDISSHVSQPIDEDFARAADRIVTMGCGDDACPAFIGRPVDDWPLDDPVDMDLDGVRRVRDEIEQRVLDLLADLEVRTDH